MSQQTEALALANTIRIGGVVLKQELRCGIVSLGQALDDDRAGHLKIQALLCAQRLFGPVKANEVLRHLIINPNRRVRDLTQRQKALIVETVGR